MKNAIQRAIMAFGYKVYKTETIDRLTIERNELEAEVSALEEKIYSLQTSGITDGGLNRSLPRCTILDAKAQTSTFRSDSNRTLIMDEYSKLSMEGLSHAAGAFPTNVLRRIEEILPPKIESSAETGCGKSTILFSNISKHHKVFALDDRNSANSSVRFFTDCSLTNHDRIETIFGSTQETLLNYNEHVQYDAVLIDGPHGYPFPELEYLFFYPHIKQGGFLIIDDVNIPTIGRLADFLAEDDMFELIETINSTSVFQRSSAPMFNPKGDGWYTQKYNRHRVSPKRDIFLDEGPVVDVVTSQKIDLRLMG